MKRLVGMIVAGLFATAALPAAAQSGALLESGGKICFSNSQMSHETPSDFQQRIRAQQSMPGWIWESIRKMQEVPDEMSFTFRQIGNDRVLIASGGVDQNAAANLDRAIKTYAPIHEIWFNSPGGSSYQGVLMGDIIRNHGASTRVLRGDGCASACSTAFLGGVMREVEPGAVYGVHIYSRSISGTVVFDSDGLNNQTAEDVKAATDRALYIGRMGIGKVWLSIWSETHPGCMTFMSQDQMRKAFVDNLD